MGTENKIDENVNNEIIDEVNPDGANPQDEPAPDNKEEKTESIDEKLRKALEEAVNQRMETKKWKAEFDKSSSEIAKLKKQIQLIQGKEEAIEAEKLIKQQEHDEYVKGLEDYKKKNEARNRYLNFGFDADLADKASEAELENDNEKLMEIYGMKERRSLEAQQKEFLRSRPDIKSGSSKEEEENPFIKGFDSVPLNRY